jgi:hypothetical protein
MLITVEIFLWINYKECSGKEKEGRTEETEKEGTIVSEE